MRGFVVWGLLIMVGIIGGCNTLASTVPPTTAPTSAPINAFATSTDAPVPTTAVVRTPVPTPVCEGLPAPRLVVHERAQIVDDGENLNLRAAPNTDATILDRIDSGAVIFVLAGPDCGTDYVWFRVRYDDTVGWIAEGERDEYYVQPYLLG